jgi:hypothetical protein
MVAKASKCVRLIFYVSKAFVITNYGPKTQPLKPLRKESDSKTIFGV